MTDETTDNVIAGEHTADRAETTSELVFDVRDITLRFGGVVSLRNVSMHMNRGEILAVIGPNGAGKTSLFNSLTGVYEPQEGEIDFTDRNGRTIAVIGKKTHRIARAGVSRTFQASRVFSALTVFENVKIGAESHAGIGVVGAMLRGPATRRGERISDELTLELLEFVGLRKEANLIASALSYGGRRRLEIARAIATDPDVILLDEPAAGTNPSEKLELAALIRRVRDERKVSVLLIEHDMKLVMSLAERIYVLNFGGVLAEGSAGRDPRQPSRRRGLPRHVHDRGSGLVLDVHDAVVRYGSIEALHGISFSIEQGEIVTLLGANGAGKSTTLRMLSGLRAPVSGSVTFEGHDITQVKAHEFAALGISHVPEGRRIFPVMTVEENLEMGAFARRGSLSDDLEEIYVMFPILKDRRKQLGSNLSGGEQQMLAIGRALMSKPRLLLLDEPSMGLAPMIIDQIFTIIKSIRELGTTIFLVEQNAAQALRLADRGYVMENGRIVFGESADDLLKDPRVRAVYLGETDDA